MDWEKYLKRLDRDMVLRSYSRHTRKVFGREVKNSLVFSGETGKELIEEDVRNYVLYLMAGNLSKKTINMYRGEISPRFLNTMLYKKLPRGQRSGARISFACNRSSG